MKGYKVFNKDWTCREFQYEVGKTYEMKEDPVCCKRGFHFCRKLKTKQLDISRLEVFFSKGFNVRLPVHKNCMD